MLEYIRDDKEPPYTKSDVTECDTLLNQFISEIETSDNKLDYQWVLSKVETLVISLNKLNERLEHSLIETDQREGICDLIFVIVGNAGHQFDGDITEEWREW